VAGALLFLPVPLVLFLFTRAPLGVLASLGLGFVLMLTHRLYARPWALARSAGRCLWCGAKVETAPPLGAELAIEEPAGRTAWRACREEHARPVRAVLAWAAARRGFLNLGILGTLVVFLAWATASGLGWLGHMAFDDAVAFFRLGIALTVLPLGWLAVRALPAPVEALRAPFPLHAPALIGLCAALWLFRLVGLLWLVQGLLHVARRTGLLG
jgi:hypothetical protein